MPAGAINRITSGYRVSRLLSAIKTSFPIPGCYPSLEQYENIRSISQAYQWLMDFRHLIGYKRPDIMLSQSIHGLNINCSFPEVPCHGLSAIAHGFRHG